MPICETCFHNKYCEIYNNGYGNKVKSCRDYKSNVQTNEEWLRQCTTEQLAEWITELSELCTIRHQCELCDSWCDEKKVMEWLKQPHREE